MSLHFIALSFVSMAQPTEFSPLMSIYPPETRRKSPIGRDATRIAAGEFAACIVRRHRSVAQRAILEQWPFAQLAGDDRLTDPRCVPDGRIGGFMFPPTVLKLAIADALVADDAKLSLGDLSKKSKLDGVKIVSPADLPPGSESPPLPPEQIAAIRQSIATEIALDLFGECVVRKAPEATEQLLRSKIASDREKSIITALAPMFGTCVAKDAKYTLSREILRGTLAITYYRLAKAPEMANAVNPKPGGKAAE